jgi:predicted phage terminase large subunit-like protein
MRNGTFVIERINRGHWAALEREQVIKRCVEHDYRNMGRDRKVYQIVIEQEPGSGGKESAEATIRNLAGYTVIAHKPTGPKEVRAEPIAAQVQGGNVYLVAGQWHQAFFEEADLHGGCRKNGATPHRPLAGKTIHDPCAGQGRTARGRYP